MDNVEREAARRKIELIILPNAEAIRALRKASEKTNAVLHITCNSKLIFHSGPNHQLTHSAKASIGAELACVKPRRSNMPDGVSESAVRDEPSRKLNLQRGYGPTRQFRAVLALRPRQILSLLTTTYNDWSSDGAARLGAALAYFTLFSVAPVLIVVTGVVGLFIGHAAATGQVAPWLERFLSPKGAEAAQLMLKQAATPTGGIVTTVAGLLTLFLGTSALVSELRHSLNVVWRVQQPPSAEAGVLAAIRATAGDRLYAFLIVVGAGLLVLASLVMNTVVAAAATYFQGLLPIPTAVLQIINFALSFALMAAMFTLLYKTVPDAHVAWGDAAIGAVATAFFFTAGTMALSIFLGTTGSGSVYGTAASVMALLLWVYYSAQVFFFGAELTRIFANTYGAQIVPHHRSLAVPWRRRPA